MQDLLIPQTMFLKSSVLLLCIFFFQNASAQSPREFEPYFTDNERFKGIYGDYRSPLHFYNGDTVKTKQEWQKREEEIRGRWMEMMGEWLPIMEKQPLEVGGTVQHEDFTQHRIKFYLTPNKQTEEYLLTPNTEGKRPAVIALFYEPGTAAGISNYKLILNTESNE